MTTPGLPKTRVVPGTPLQIPRDGTPTGSQTSWNPARNFPLECGIKRLKPANYPHRYFQIVSPLTSLVAEGEILSETRTRSESVI